MASFRKSTLERVEFKTPLIRGEKVPLIIDDWTLCFRLGFSGKAFWYVMGNRDRLYKVFKIKKASGGLRMIHNPRPLIKLFLTQLRTRVLLPLTEQLGAHVAAYQVGKSTRDAAQMHLAKCTVCEEHEGHHTCEEYVVEKGKGAGYKMVKKNEECAACKPVPKHDCTRRGVKVHMDLKDFFGSTRRAWIRRYFHETVGYNHYVSSLLGTLMTVKFEMRGKEYHGVPQGAPTSGDICNLVADVRLDAPILKALAGTGWVYTRYADDLYFSHSENLSKDAVNQMIGQIDNHIRASGYRMNRRKLHVQRPHKRQQFLGIVLNEKLSIPRDAYGRIRCILKNCYHHGFESQAKRAKYDNTEKFVAWLRGKISYMSAVDPHKANRLKAALDLALKRHGMNKPASVSFVNGERVA